MLKKIFTLLLGATFLFVACNKDENKNLAKENTKNEIIIAQEGEAKTLDPHQGNDGFSLKVTRLIYSRLVEADPDMKIYPGLAQSWEQLDNQTTKFNLRKNVKFHNGEIMTAEDVKFSLERMMASPRVAFVVPPIEKIEILDEHTITITTKTPFAPLLAHLAHPALGIVNKKQLTEREEEFKNNPLGTGAYKFKEWTHGTKMLLEKNEDFYDKNEKGFKYIVFRPIVEEASRLIGLETGEIDVAQALYALNEKAVKNNPKLELYSKPSFSTLFLGMNNTKAPLDNIKVRQAINHAIDKESIINAVLAGSGVIPNAPIASNVFGSTSKTKNYDFNVDTAKQLLKEAGFENGLELSLMLRGGEVNTQTAEIIQANLKEIGINVKIEILESGTFLDLTSNGKHELYLGSWGVVTGDADYGLYSLYHSSTMGAAGNKDFYKNEKVDKLLESARAEINPDTRKKLYEEAQIEIINDSPNVLLFSRNITLAGQKNIKGLNVHPVTLHNFASTYIEN